MTHIQKNFFIFILCLTTWLLNACGGDSHGAYNNDSGKSVAPAAISNLNGNSGDGAVSLGWAAPSSGSAPFTYNITISPSAPNATITSNDTRALIRGLTNNTVYTFSITAKNNHGESSAATLPLKPTAITTDLSQLSALSISGMTLNSSSGIFDASVLNVSNTLWAAYSSVNYYQASGQTVQDVSTSLAFSNDGGASYAYVNTIGNATSTQVTPRSNSPCGNTICNGRWVYELPFLVDDKNEPDSSKRFKLFALKYFLYPPAAATRNAAHYEIGAIVMWTAASPGNGWSSEQVVLGWNLTPPELTAKNNINTLNSALAECTSLSEGSATIYQDDLDLDFVFACSNNISNTQKIIMLRSSDHASTFKYVGTLLEANDANSFNARYFSAPALITSETNAPLLLVTPVINRTINLGGTITTDDVYSGCIAFPIADEETGALFRNTSQPLSILQIGYLNNHLNGACSWDQGAVGGGILMNDLDTTAAPLQFKILKTGRNF